jgi:basic membrane protein A
MQLASFRAVKFWIFVIIAIFLTSNFKPAIAATTPNTAIKIAVIYDVGGRGDKSYDDMVALGIDSAKKKFGLTSFNVREMVTVGTEFDRENRLEFLVKAGYKLVIAVGANFHNAVGYMAEKYPENEFAIIGDSTLEYLNVSSLDFAQEQGSFLAGVFAAASSKSGKVGYIGDASDPKNLIDQKYFIAGVNYAAPKVLLITKQVSSGIKLETSELISKGVDIIYSTWSQNGELLSQISASNSAKQSVKFIGIAPDQFFLNSKESKKYLIGYVSKRYDTAAKELVAGAIANQTILDEINAVTGVYGRMYSLANGVEFKIVAGAPAAKAAVSRARERLISKRIKSAI